MKSSLVFDLSQALCELRDMKVLLRVGLKRNSAGEKIDLLAGCNEGNIEKCSHIIKALLKDRWPTGNFFVCDDSVRFDLAMGSGGVAVCDSALLIKRVEEWISGKNLGGQHRPWAIGYWVPEALCGDLATADALYDVADISIRLRELLVPYPISLSKSIVELCVDEIKQRLSTLENLHENATIEQELCLSDIITSMIRLLFARSRRYFRGFRSLGQQASLLESSDLLIYELTLELLKRKKVIDVISEVKKLL